MTYEEHLHHLELVF
jgi:hypothetical protein